jgi:PAS domain S-box-containing protein
MKKCPYNQAKEAILDIHRAAVSGVFDSREKFLALLDANPQIAVQGYNPYGIIFYWNDASADLYGHSESAAINRNIFELILPPEMRPLAKDMIACAQKTGKTPEAGACDLMRHNGDRVTVFSGHLMFNWDGAAVPEFYCIDLAIDTNPEPVALENSP